LVNKIVDKNKMTQPNPTQTQHKEDVYNCGSCYLYILPYYDNDSSKVMSICKDYNYCNNVSRDEKQCIINAKLNAQQKNQHLYPEDINCSNAAPTPVDPVLQCKGDCADGYKKCMSGCSQ